MQGFARFSESGCYSEEKLRRAFAWLHDHAADFSGDRDRMYLGGHSFGAHLAGTLVATDSAALGMPADVVTAAILCSKMYDLVPVSLVSLWKRSAFVTFDATTLDTLSPAHHIARISAPLVLAYGTEETPEFQRQSRDFAAALRASGNAVDLLVGIGYNHFDIMETMGSPFGLLGRALLHQLGRRG